MVAGPSVQATLTSMWRNRSRTISVIRILDGFSSEIPIFRCCCGSWFCAAFQRARVGHWKAGTWNRAVQDPTSNRQGVSFADALAAYPHRDRGPFGKIMSRVQE